MKRGRFSLGAAYADLNPLREALEDGRMWIAKGLVWKPPDAASHYRVIKDGDTVTEILVEVLTVPDKQDLSCALAVPGGGAGSGIWSIPPVGTHVVVALPAGAVDFQPTIIGGYASNAAPSRIDETRTVIVATGTVEIHAPKIVLAANPEQIVDAEDGVVVGRAIDTFTGSPYFALGNTSSIVKVQQ